MSWLRADTSKEPYSLFAAPPLGIRCSIASVPTCNTHDHRLERQCDVPIPMEAFKTRDRRLLRRQSSLEVDKLREFLTHALFQILAFGVFR